VDLQTSHKSDTTDDKVIAWGLREQIRRCKDTMELWPPTGTMPLISPLEGDHPEIHCNGDVIENALTQHQDTTAPEFLTEPEHTEVKSVRPQRSYLGRGYIKCVRRVKPKKIDLDCVR